MRLHIVRWRAFSRHDADAYERYSSDTMRQCRLIRDFLLSTAPDPTSFKPKDLLGLMQIGKQVLEEMGEERHVRDHSILDDERCRVS